MTFKVNSNRARVTSTIGEVPKQVFTIGDCKGVIEPSSPRKFRMWVLITGLEMLAEVLTDSIEDGKSRLIEQINHLRAVVPARRAAFERLEAALKAKFAILRHGYEFLNSIQDRWRESSTERLIELAETVEAINENAACGICGNHSESGLDHWDCELLGLETVNKIQPVLENLPKLSTNSKNDTCAECGRPSFNGKVHLHCEYKAQQKKKRGEPTVSTGLTADASNSENLRTPSSKFSDSDNAPYLKQGSIAQPKRERVGNLCV